MDPATLINQAIETARWATPFIVAYLIWVHRELVMLRKDVERNCERTDALADRQSHHEQSDGLIAAQIGELKVMVARLEERIDAFLHRAK